MSLNLTGIFPNDRPITVTKVDGGYTMTIKGQPLVKVDATKHRAMMLVFDRAAAGVKGASKPLVYGPLPIHVFPALAEAMTAAHQVGRYILGIGDFVETYTAVR